MAVLSSCTLSTEVESVWFFNVFFFLLHSYSISRSCFVCFSQDFNSNNKKTEEKKRKKKRSIDIFLCKLVSVLVL